MDSPENMYSVQVSPLHSPLLSWNVFLNTPYTDLPGGRSMMVMCHVLSPMQAMGQRKEDEFAMGGRETLSMSRVSELMLATPTTTTCLYFNSRGRLLVGMNHASLSHRWLYKFPKKKGESDPELKKLWSRYSQEKKKRERDYKNTAKIKINKTAATTTKKTQRKLLDKSQDWNVPQSPSLSQSQDSVQRNSLHISWAFPQIPSGICWDMVGVGEGHTHEWQMASSFKSIYLLRGAIKERSDSNISRAKWN